MNNDFIYNSKLDDIIIARKKLEAIGLLKTYMKKDNINQYVYFKTEELI